MYKRFALRRHLVALLIACSILLFLAACGTDEATTPTSTPAQVTQFPSPPSSTETPIRVSPTTQVILSPAPSMTEIPAAEDWDNYPSLNDIRSLAFGPDGSLWAGTSSGVVRWDLATDTHLRYSTADGLASDDITDLAFAPDGTLWVTARGGGVSHFDGTEWTSYTEADGLISNIVYDIATASDGSVWVGTQNGVSHFDGKAWTSYTMADGLADNVVWYVAVALDDKAWFSTHAGGVSRYDPGQNTWTTYSTEHGLPLPNARFLTIGPDGAPWLHIGYDHVYRFDGTTWQVAYEAGGGQWVCDIAFAADGSPWVATCGGYHAYGAGLAHLDGTTWIYATTEDGLVDNDVSAVAVAPDGTIAAGTDRGLSVYQAGQWRTLRTGPTLSRVTTVAVTSDGAAWFGFGDDAFRSAGGGLSRFDGQSWQYVSQANGFPASDNVRALAVAPDGALWAGAGCGVARLERPVEAAEGDQVWQTIATCDDLHGNVLDIVFTLDGAAWVTTGFSLERFDGRSRTSYEKKVHSLAAAPDGAIWANGWEGLQGSDYVARFDGESWTTYQVADSFPGTFRVEAVTSDGRVWGVVPERGVACFDGQSWTDGRSWAFYPVSDQVFDLAVAPNGVLWAITDRGPAYFKGDVWDSVQWDDGLGTINAIAFAPDGSLWFGTSEGAVHFRLSEAAPTQSQSMKGYELYSWQEREDWYFALVVGTNRIKTFDEIAAPEVRVRGLEALKGRLDQLPRGEQVFWPDQWVPNTALPPDELVEEVRAYCEQRGIQLTLTAQAVEVRWDTSPTALIIRYYSPHTTAGLAGAYNSNYYIPEVQVWGDGRIIWVRREGIGRRVLESHLTTDQMQALLQRVVDAGFFNWKDKYYTLGGYSYPPMYLLVNLAGYSKEMYEHGGAPDAFYELRQTLTSGAGAVGHDYVPSRGYLTAVPGPNEANAPAWPDATAGITLDQVGDGCYIEGEALAFAWQLVNENPTSPVYAKSNGQVYAIMVQIPGVSFFEPPATAVQRTLTPEQRNCAGPNTFPIEEAELIWPELREVQPDQVAPGDEVEILGAGGHLYWDNECGQFWLESARDFQLFFDGEPAGLIICYANLCVTNLTVPADTLSGTHVISVEGGSKLSIEVSGK